MTLDRDARPFLVVSGLATLAVVVWAPWLAVVPAALFVFTLNFFRDPERVPPQDSAAVVAPADGRIIRADERRVSIFMNIFDVHVCRSPVGGRIRSVTHHPGKFFSAFKDAASEHNERLVIVVEPPAGPPVTFTLVAGLIARRIVARVAAGQPVACGARVGLIRFGSRVDVEVCAGMRPAVAIGDRVVSGESVIARRAPE